MGAEYLSYVKFIATYALTFFGYIISVLADVRKEACYSELILFYFFTGGLIAFCMEVAEFLVVTCASSLTLAIIGVFKEVTILTLAVIIKGNEITFINLCGMVICLLGIFAHVIRKTIKGQLISKYPLGVFWSIRWIAEIQSNLAIRNGLIRNKLVLWNHFL